MRAPGGGADNPERNFRMAVTRIADAIPGARPARIAPADAKPVAPLSPFEAEPAAPSHADLLRAAQAIDKRLAEAKGLL